jgi:hypothetical protein
MAEEVVVVMAYRMLVAANIEAMVQDIWFVIVKAVVVVELDWLMKHENHVSFVCDRATNLELCYMLH